MNAALVQALTRGNGQVGDDVTHNARTIVDLPLKLSGDAPALLEVRGEVYMTEGDLAQLNEQQLLRGEPTYANTRNVTAGSIRLLDPQVAATRRMRFFGHGLGDVAGLTVLSHSEFLSRLRGFGLPTAPASAS